MIRWLSIALLWVLASPLWAGFEEGLNAYHQGDYHSALSEWHAIASSHPHAQYNIGVLYERGLGVTANKRTALKWYRQSANQGLAAAQTMLGNIYRQGGYGQAKDYKQAAKWYGLAAKQNDIEAQYYLGVMHHKALGMVQDDKEALHWWQQAANRNHARAQYALGRMYYEGQQIPQDYREAFKWFRLAAGQGITQAQSLLGNMYEHGEGITRDESEAVSWYRRAAEQGEPNAQTNLANMYLQGRSVYQDQQEAVHWYQAAAEQGLSLAQYNLGVMYSTGRNLTQDQSEAYKWFSLAARGKDRINMRAGQKRDEVARQLNGGQLVELQQQIKKWRPTRPNRSTAKPHVAEVIVPVSAKPETDAQASTTVPETTAATRELTEAAAVKTPWPNNSNTYLMIIPVLLLSSLFFMVPGISARLGIASGIFKLQRHGEQRNTNKTTRPPSMLSPLDIDLGTYPRIANEQAFIPTKTSSITEKMSVPPAQTLSGSIDTKPLPPILGDETREQIDIHSVSNLQAPDMATSVDEIAQILHQAEQGNAIAQAKLGSLYLRGKGVEQNYQQAAKWWMRSAEQGEINAQANLGIAYVTGQGVRRDYLQAYKWLALAAKGNFPSALKARDKVARYLPAVKIAEIENEIRHWRPVN